MDLTTGYIGSYMGCPSLIGRGERSRLAVPAGQDHGSADGSQNGQSRRSADLAAGVEQA
jgi:hypothetical protein